MNCMTCKYFEPDHEPDANGWCHRYPPQMYGEESSSAYSESIVGNSTFPWVAPSEWCGEWEKKPE